MASDSTTQRERAARTRTTAATTKASTRTTARKAAPARKAAARPARAAKVPVDFDPELDFDLDDDLVDEEPARSRRAPVRADGPPARPGDVRSIVLYAAVGLLCLLGTGTVAKVAFSDPAGERACASALRGLRTTMVAYPSKAGMPANISTDFDVEQKAMEANCRYSTVTSFQQIELAPWTNGTAAQQPASAPAAGPGTTAPPAPSAGGVGEPTIAGPTATTPAQ